MREIIRKLYIENKFDIDNELLSDLGHDCFYAERIKDNKYDFHIILFENAKELNATIKDNLVEFLNVIIVNKQNYIGIDKNLSLLILLECESSTDHEEISPIIFDIEEDPYDFKKYVLPYEFDEVHELKRNLSKISTSSMTSYIESKLIDVNLFSDFKANIDSARVKEYQLITKLYIKMPFLNLKVAQQGFLNLSDLINKGIQAEDKHLWNKLLDFRKTNGSKDISTEEIMSLLEEEKSE